jgi:hypothetical protein
MAQQKLYTEEQMAKVWMAGQKYWETSGASITFEELLEHEKPIELPSDEEIEEKAEFLFPTVNRMGGPTYIAHKSFIEGAKWMKEQILNK